MAYLYRHIRLDKNEPFYIGIATHLKRAYDKSSRKNKIWQSIISKTNYEVEILFNDLTRDEVLKKEIEFIKLYGRIDKKTGTLSNLTDGGEDFTGQWNKGRKASEETKAKQRAAAKNKPPRSKESIKKSADGIRGIAKSEEHKRKISQFFKGKSKGKWTKEQRENNKEYWLNQYYPIIQYDLNNNIIKVWNNRTFASIELNLKKDQIRECLRNKRIECGGFKWAFLK